MGIALAGLLAFGSRWLWRQRWRGATAGRRALIVSVSVACLVLLTFFVGGIELLWHERGDQPVTVEDLRILEKADALLKDESSWNRHDAKQCDKDNANRKWSLYCALEAACSEVVGQCEHTRVASQEVRFAIEEASPGRQFEGRLMGFNNLPETRFQDIKRVLRVARERVTTRLTEADRMRLFGGDQEAKPR
jgi:hypothetical protein